MARTGLWVAALLLAAGARAGEGGKGKELFGAKCAACHGKDAKGNPGMAKAFKLDLAALDLVDEATLAKKDADLTSVTSKGRGKMPAFAGKLSDTEIVGVLAYLRVLGAPAEPTKGGASAPAPGLDPAAAAATFKAKCVSCHGKDAKGNPAMAKSFKVEPAAMDLTDKETLAKKNEELAAITAKGKGKMPGFSGKMEEGEIAGVVGYIRSLGKPDERPR